MALSQKLTHSFNESEVEKKWYLVDATGLTLGRVASRVAHVLRGKNKPQFSPNADCGDFVVIVNAEKVKIATKRAELKTYFRHTGYPGGATTTTYATMIRTKPADVLFKAIKGMIPHNRLGAEVIKKLKVYTGETHPHAAQKPEVLKLF